MLIEPTESESLEEIDRFCDAMIQIRKEADDIISGKQPKDNNLLKNAPHPISVMTLSDAEWNRCASVISMHLLRRPDFRSPAPTRGTRPHTPCHGWKRRSSGQLFLGLTMVSRISLTCICKLTEPLVAYGDTHLIVSPYLASTPEISHLALQCDCPSVEETAAYIISPSLYSSRAFRFKPPYSSRRFASHTT